MAFSPTGVIIQTMILNDFLKENPVIYVAKEPDKGLGFLESREGFFVMTPKEKIFPEIEKKFPKTFLYSSPAGNSRLILENSENLKTIKEKKAKILVFKNTAQIETLVKKNDLEILNPKSEISAKIENKLEQFNWLEELKEFLPPNSKTSLVKDLLWKGEPFILQWNIGHSGDGTIFVENEKDLEQLKKTFPNRLAKTSKKINGHTFTSNNVAFADRLKIGNLSFQITGFKPLTENPFSTVGNDFGLPKKILSEKNLTDYKLLAEKIGQKIITSGFFGIFGLDLIFDPENQKWHLLEINARQTSSSCLESWLGEEKDADNTIFSNHLSALLSLDCPDNPLPEINQGGILILRKNPNLVLSPEKIAEKLKNLTDFVFTYDSEEKNAEILRIYSKQNLFLSPKEMTKTGKKIIEIIEKNGN